MLSAGEPEVANNMEGFLSYFHKKISSIVNTFEDIQKASTDPNQSGCSHFISVVSARSLFSCFLPITYSVRTCSYPFFAHQQSTPVHKRYPAGREKGLPYSVT